MYYPLGWPRILKLPPVGRPAQEAGQGDPAGVAGDGGVGEVKQVACSRDKILTAILTSQAVQIWYVKPTVPIISHRRSQHSIEELGENVLVQWRPDSSMIGVVTSLGHLIIYHIVVPTDIKTLYDQVDAPNGALKRESDELFVKEVIPPLIFSLAFETNVEGGIADLVSIREELMIATHEGRILRYGWDGQEIRDYSLDLRRIPFCVDQQVLKAVPLADRGAYVAKISYSPLLGGYAIILNDGRAAFLVASNANFDPNSVTGIWAPQLEDATCIALNHKYKLMAFGRKNSQGIVYNVDEMTGGLAITHRLALRTRDYPGCPGAVTALRWTPDGTCLAMTWSRGGFSLWSTFGAMIMCSLCWDYGVDVSDPVVNNPLCLTSIDWSAEGYQLWMVNTEKRGEEVKDPEFMPFPSERDDDRDHKNGKGGKDERNPLANKLLMMQFVKSPISVNPGMSKQEHIYLQGEDSLYLNLGQTREFNDKASQHEEEDGDVIDVSRRRSRSSRSLSMSMATSANSPSSRGNISLKMMSSGSKHWTTIRIPHTYMGSSWPIRFTGLDSQCQYLAVAGRTGLAHYSVQLRKWRLFGNETQEKDFIVTGGLLWWRQDFIIVGCYNLAALQDEVRIYARQEKLDNANAKIVRVDAQILLLNLLKDQLVVFCADNQISIFNLALADPRKPSSLSCELHRTVDANQIPGLSFHPACVILVALTHLKTETLRSGNRDSLSRESPPASSPPPPMPSSASSMSSSVETPSIILNVCGRVVMLQLEQYDPRDGRDSPPMTLPTVLASCCETIWFPRQMNPDKPHLTASLWLYCGAHGMRVWLPVFPREGDKGHTFMSKRIMLHFPMHRLYPLAILFEDAIILGADNDTVLLKCNGMNSSNVPYSTLERTSLLFLHPILRQLIRRNLGYHAWEIARTCMMLPYFQHSLELLLHEVLEEEATSTEPIPDALLPSVVEFIQEFPVFHKTIGRCARKTEVALWPHLFAVVGSPRTLFLECLNLKDLDTASAYLLILQNLEPPAVAQNHATLLLDASLDTCSWELAKDLVRFLRTIDPDELDEVAQQRPPPHFGLTPQTPPINSSAPVEDISLLLGTMQVPRGRSTSTTQSAKISPRELTRSNSESKTAAGGSSATPVSHRARKASSSSGKDQPVSGGGGGAGGVFGGSSSAMTAAAAAAEAHHNALMSGSSAEEFFIDVILQRHARKLVAQVRLFDLGTFSAQLDFHMVAWLKREATRAARVDNFVQALKKVHADFAWPFPILLNSVVRDLKRKQTQSQTTPESSSVSQASSFSFSPPPHQQQQQQQPHSKPANLLLPGAPTALNCNANHAYVPSLDDKFRTLKVDVSSATAAAATTNRHVLNNSVATAGAISDSGYISHPKDESDASYADQNNLLSEHTIHAMLKPHSFREDLSMISDDAGSVTSPDGVDPSSLDGASNADHWASLQSHSNLISSHQDPISKGPHKSEVQLRYLLQIMLEANCLEIASIICVVLKDALALIRIVNAARTSADSKVCVTRLYRSLRALEAWAQADCPGYVPFFQAIQPQLSSLKSFLNLQSPPQQQPQANKASSPPPSGLVGMGGGHPHPHPSVKATASLPPLPPRLPHAAAGRKNSPGIGVVATNHVHTSVATAATPNAAKSSAAPKLIAKQRSLPSGMTTTEVPSTTTTTTTTVNHHSSPPVAHKPTTGRSTTGPGASVGFSVGDDTRPQKQIRNGGERRLENEGEDEEDTRSVTSDILPEGQDEQPGCTLS